TGLLAQCRRFLRVVALSNTNAVHADVWRVRHADVLRHFERIFVSHEMGARKPEPECFRQVLEYLAVAPRRVVFIDDCAENVEAAVRLGMKGIVATGAVETARRLRDMGVPLDA
ncbi:MAG TPA: HAD-IA family hydrolase, partial [Phycisphaerae bacterium]|nr:HAD-IA family hydrolase [Phycisphaerae bacterium]